MDERIFSGCFPTGIVYADRQVEVRGDYKRLAYMNYGSLVLELEDDCPEPLAEQIKEDHKRFLAMKGHSYPIAGNASVVLGCEMHLQPGAEAMFRGEKVTVLKRYWDDLYEIEKPNGEIYNMASKALLKPCTTS